jgi:mannosyl-oligosaccharide alpha-1,2-mannosidase
MQIPEIVDTIVEFIPTIDFDVTDSEISLFETTIRYIGGMLSGKKLYHMSEANIDISKATASYRGRYPI